LSDLFGVDVEENQTLKVGDQIRSGRSFGGNFEGKIGELDLLL